MEVTRINFQEVLKELDNVLEKAAFLGIDGEFTGLNSGPEARAFDTPVQYYDKLRSGSMDFLLVQFGLSVFTYDSNANKYSQQSYNFYVFPRPLNRSAPDCRFMCQASSISFLANQGFDFNKLFKLGIPYLTTAEEEKLSKRLEDKHKVRDEGPEVIQISDHDKPQIEEICSQIEEFLSSDAEELMIDRCNAFIRRIVHQEVKIRWPNKLRLDCKTDFSRQYLIVQKAGTKEEELELEKEKREKEKQEVQDAFGLSALLKKIADSGKLLVGHNMLLDLCHIVHQFFVPLPESYTEFKALVHNLFPRLLDTKVMCESKQFKDLISSSNLYIMQERMSKKPFSIPEIEAVEGRSYDISEEKTHEAGYDAFITGICFIAMINYLGSVTNPEVTMVHPDSPLLTRYINKLLIPRLKDFPYVNLEGKDPDTNRDNVFHLTFPKTWKYSDITQLFNPYGGVYVSWLSETTAYVALNRRDQISTVMKNLGGSKIYRLRKYSDHQAASQKSALNKQGNKKSNQKEGKAEKKEKLESVLPSTGNIGAKEEEEEDGGWEVATGNYARRFIPLPGREKEEEDQESNWKSLLFFMRENLSTRRQQILGSDSPLAERGQASREMVGDERFCAVKESKGPWKCPETRKDSASHSPRAGKRSKRILNKKCDERAVGKKLRNPVEEKSNLTERNHSNVPRSLSVSNNPLEDIIFEIIQGIAVMFLIWFCKSLYFNNI